MFEGGRKGGRQEEEEMSVTISMLSGFSTGGQVTLYVCLQMCVLCLTLSPAGTTTSSKLTSPHNTTLTGGPTQHNTDLQPSLVVVGLLLGLPLLL